MVHMSGGGQARYEGMKWMSRHTRALSQARRGVPAKIEVEGRDLCAPYLLRNLKKGLCIKT
jgi:hypothetical protein